MSYVTRGGIEVVDDDSVPEGEFHVYAPGPQGMKIQYRFHLSDHMLTTATGRTFLRDLETELRALIDMPGANLQAGLSGVLQRVKSAQTGDWGSEMPPFLAELG